MSSDSDEYSRESDEEEEEDIDEIERNIKLYENVIKENFSIFDKTYQEYSTNKDIDELATAKSLNKLLTEAAEYLVLFTEWAEKHQDFEDSYSPILDGFKNEMKMKNGTVKGMKSKESKISPKKNWEMTRNVDVSGLGLEKLSEEEKKKIEKEIALGVEEDDEEENRKKREIEQKNREKMQKMKRRKDEDEKKGQKEIESYLTGLWEENYKKREKIDEMLDGLISKSENIVELAKKCAEITQAQNDRLTKIDTQLDEIYGKNKRLRNEVSAFLRTAVATKVGLVCCVIIIFVVVVTVIVMIFLIIEISKRETMAAADEGGEETTTRRLLSSLF